MAGEFLRGSPVQHSVLLRVPTSRLEQSRQQDAATGGEADLWLWIERDGQVIAAAQHAAPFRAYLSPAPPEAVRLLAGGLYQRRPNLPGLGGLRPGPMVFAAEWRRLGGGAAAVVRACSGNPSATAGSERQWTCASQMDATIRRSEPL